MPEHLRALIVLIAIAVFVFILFKSAACKNAIDESDYSRRRNIWFGITLSAYLSHNFWIFMTISMFLLVYGLQREGNKLSLYFFVFFAVPQIQDTIYFSNIKLFHFHYGHLVSLIVLIPAFFEVNHRIYLSKKHSYPLQDKILIAYLFLLLLLHHKAETVPEIFRLYIFYPTIEVVLPYYIASRSLTTIKDFRDALMSFIVACIVLAVIAVFECGRHWLLYSSLQTALGIPWNYGKYLGRGAFLRALGTPGQAIALGYVMAVAIGIFLYFRSMVSSRTLWRVGITILTAGLIAALSRGPWIGAVVMIIVFILSGPRATPNIAKLCGIVSVLLIIVSGTPAWKGIVEYLPFVGSVDSENVEFRQSLLDGVVDIILENPILGSKGTDLEQFRTGEGIIDIVNTYLIIGLESGLTGIALFFAFFATTCLGIYKGMLRLQNKDSEEHILGRTLLAVLIGIMLIIFTVSSITVIPYVYWSMAGVGVAYMRLVSQPNNNGGVLIIENTHEQITTKT